jgi:CHASE1-domain containing sensor protein
MSDMKHDRLFFCLTLGFTLMLAAAQQLAMTYTFWALVFAGGLGIVLVSAITYFVRDIGKTRKAGTSIPSTS